MKTILILDDNKDILQALQIGLSGCLKDCRILTAQNGEQGREIMKTTPVDMVITDLDMPVMTGFQFIEKTQKEHPGVPVCVIAGDCSPEITERLKNLGITRVIGKPYLFDHLTDMITRELAQQRLDGPVQRSGGI